MIKEDAPTNSTGAAVAGTTEPVGRKSVMGLQRRMKKKLNESIHLDEADFVIRRMHHDYPGRQLVLKQKNKETGKMEPILFKDKREAQAHADSIKHWDSGAYHEVRRYKKNNVFEDLDNIGMPGQMQQDAEDGTVTPPGPDDMFGNTAVFDVDSHYFHNCRMGKIRYHRYDKYVGDDEQGERIRQFGRSTTGPIALRDRNTQAMMYLRYGK
jgi:hypothetical protein